MEVFVFLLGGALGVSMSSLSLLMERAHKVGLTEDALLDIVYECASIIFVFALFNVYMQLR